MIVSELMNKSVVTVSGDETAAFAADLLARHNLGALPVCASDGSMRGIVTDRDIVLRCVAAEEDPWETPVRDVMSRGVVSISPDEDVRKAAQLMAREQIRRLPVVKNNRLVGMLSLGDLAKTRAFDMEASRALSEISDNIRRY